jgi:type I restriction enzyme S subunit
VKRYPKYKDSGVPWLGQVPAHWEVKRAKYLLRQLNRPADGETEIVTAFRDGVVTRRSNRREDGFTISTKEIGYQGVKTGDFVLHSMDAAAGCVGVSDSDGKCSPVYAVCSAVPNANQWYLSDVFRVMAAAGWIAAHSKGIRQRSTDFRFDELAAQFFPLPTRGEQDVIISFLRHVTLEIDSAISSQERMIELLKERRSAIITQAVTKGLNPKAKMKDSGVPWLGQVPAHWEVRPLKSLAWSPGTLFIDGDWIESENISDAGIRYLTSGNVGEGLYKEQGAGFITPETFQELNCEEVFPRDVLISRLNLPIGRACVVPDLGQRIVTCVDNVILRTNGSFSPNFLAYLFSSKTHFDNMETLGRGSTMLRISRTTLGNVRFAFPPFNEQLSIVKYLDAVVAELDSTISSQERMIELLKERRSAIITQAVTGQIDVR